MKKNILFNEIFNKFGSITRARNCFLYSKKGIRLTDLYQENGRAILGWDAGNAFTFFKNVLNRGQTGSFISEDCGKHYRLEKAISDLLFSTRKVFVFSNKSDAITSGLFFSQNNTSIWKPWSSENITWSEVDSIIITPPLPWTDSIYLLAVKQTENLKSKLQELDSPEKKLESEIEIPFALETGITRSIYNLIKEIQNRQEKDWFIYDSILTKYWTRKGPYLYPKIPQEDYDDFILHCLDCELIINPDYNSPSIIPFGADKGVFSKLKNNPFLPRNK